MVPLLWMIIHLYYTHASVLSLPSVENLDRKFSNIVAFRGIGFQPVERNDRLEAYPTSFSYR
jgi:hypothetical protein